MGETMSKLPISLTISPNETNTPGRIADLMAALKTSTIQYVGKDSKQSGDPMLRQGSKCTTV